ncbi:MAG: 4-(cytidine 5'-diphospho)-2-C-methyl-D-erythritol kinase [Lachnospiraceae bacterium]|nr:4-(cytidine 5'-diphospho)-2-C-methyl-D-erythritol kinase [Lachnospiraceae bacterium]
MDKMECKARAKVNLGLDVCRRLENGYHEVKMVMQTIDLYDVLEFTKRKDPDIILSVDSQDTLGDITNNLIFKAAKLMIGHFSIKEGIEIHLSKHIPVAAGMAGGSTDAAATMIAMNELFELGQTREQLMELSLQLGADVPFCIMGGTALAEGIGEKLTKLPAPPQTVVLIAKPSVMVSTKEVYENLKVDTLEKHPDIDGMVAAIGLGSLSGISDRMENVLETVTIGLHPEIEQIKTFMKEHKAINAMMSGSGPTVFGLYASKEEAQEAADALKETGLAKDICVTEFYNEER